MVSNLNGADSARYLKAEADRMVNQAKVFLGSAMNPGYALVA